MFQKWYDGHKARVIISDKPEKVEFVTENGVAHLIEQAANRNNLSNVIIIGHSMGGALAMQVADNLSRDLKIHSLVTLDPISQNDCNYGYITGSILTFGTPTVGCTTTPSEITPEMRTNIRSRVSSDNGRWGNVFQSDFNILHSGDISQANFNKRLTFSDSIFESYSSHNLVWYSHETWEIITTITGMSGFIAPEI